MISNQYEVEKSKLWSLSLHKRVEGRKRQTVVVTKGRRDPAGTRRLGFSSTTGLPFQWPQQTTQQQRTPLSFKSSTLQPE